MQYDSVLNMSWLQYWKSRLPPSFTRLLSCPQRMQMFIQCWVFSTIYRESTIKLSQLSAEHLNWNPKTTLFGISLVQLRRIVLEVLMRFTHIKRWWCMMMSKHCHGKAMFIWNYLNFLSVHVFIQALDLKPNYVRAWSNMGISYANQVRPLCLAFKIPSYD